MSCQSAQAFSIRTLWLSLCIWIGLVGVSQAATGDAKALLREAEQATWVAEGHGHREIYIIFDPNCPYCHLVYVETQPYLKTYQFRWVPVAILTATSLGKAGAILEARDRKAAMEKNEDYFVRARGKLGGLKPLEKVTERVRRALARNRRLLMKTGTEVVPTIIFLDRHGKPMIIKGAPSKADFPSLLNEVSSLSNAN